MTSPMPTTSTLTPLSQPASRSDQVAGSIRLAILEGRIQPGDTLVERRLAEQLGVSKTPVREALIGLASSGLVTLSPNRGVSVRRLALGDLRQIYQMRVLLEPWAVRRSTEEPPADGWAEARGQLEEARSLLDADHDRSHAKLSLANRRFHRSLYAGCGNDLVIRQLEGLSDLTALGVVSLLWERSPTWVEEFAEHEEILRAAESGKGAAAERMARQHIERSLGRLDLPDGS